MPKRILVLDDDPDIGTMIKMILEFRGHWVRVVDRAQEIANIVVDDSIEILIMDMLLSGVNGTDVCRQLKSDEKTGHLRIIMISAHPNARELCIQAGADDFLAKPFDMDEMLARIDRLRT